MAGGVSAGSRDQSGSTFSTDASVSETDSPANAWRPLSISYSTAPNDQISERRSAALPLACSGDMYAAVPMITPAVVAPDDNVGEWVRSAANAARSSIAFANPKSSTLTTPSAATLMLAGLRSRWMTPCS